MAHPRIQVLLTFDYELFHGRNLVSDEEVLFRPTETILSECSKRGLATTLFPDVCSVWAHRRFGLHAFAERFEEQLRSALRQGHDVQLHVHPHWLFSTWQDGEWRMDAERLQLHDLPFDDSPTGAGAVIRQGARWLEDLLQPVDPGYRCVAFRAAALALQPRERELLAALQDAGITIDTSVTKGVRSRTDTFLTDYSSVPARANWFMRPETGLAEAPGGEGSVWEVPIGTFQLSRLDRVGFLRRRLGAVGERRGTTMARATRQTRLGSLAHLLLMNLRYLSRDAWFVMSCDTKGFNLEMLVRGFEEYLERHRSDASIAVAIINHPKLMFDAQIRLLVELTEGLRDRHGDALEFTTLRALHERLPATVVPAEGVPS